MKSLWYSAQIAIVAIGSSVSWFLGGMDMYLYALMFFIIADYITGVMKSIVKRSLSSQIGTKGIFKKTTIFILIGLTNLIDEYLLMGNGIFKNAVILFYISNEGISILENAYAIGLPIPEKLKNFLKQLKSEK
ncbi:MAG: phage holin family protein [Defluviitaleaceae bacterium]|nr:phage holin family protein [Defluviitaleaceae bacterium]